MHFTIIKAEAIISDLHKIENSCFKKTTYYILHFKSPGLLSEKWTDMVQSLLQWRSQDFFS